MAAIAANAASFTWKTSTTGKLYSAGTSTTLASGTAYWFDADKLTQAALLDAVLGGSDISTLGALSTANISSGGISGSYEVPSTLSVGATVSAYIAVVVDDTVFVSATGSGTVPATGSTPISYNLKTASQEVASEWTVGTGSANAGWYVAGTSPIPEPTSGILMLLGFAGLALRRRRA